MPRAASWVVNELKVAPLAKPAWKALLAAAAALNKLLGSPGEMGSPVGVNEPRVGGLLRKLSAMVAGKESLKIPTPPRITVLSPEKGLKVKPTRGCHTTKSVPG